MRRGGHPTGEQASWGVLPRRALAAVSIVLAVLAAGCAGAEPPNGGPPVGDPSLPLALVYNGPQGCDECAPAIAEVLRTGPRPYRVQYVGPGTGTPLTAETLAGAQLYVQPGGGQDLQRTWQDLAPSAEAVRSWVRAGGSYLGLCFGGYLAGDGPGFGLLPGDALGYTDTPGATVPDDRNTVVDVTWRGTPRHMFFQDGPAFALRDGTAADVLARYPNGATAVVVAPYGQGRVGVSGPHPEADLSWYEEHGLTNPDGVRPDLVHELIDATTTRG